MSEDGVHVFPQGKMIEEYRVDQHIGHGGYGEIYSVLDTKSEKMYAMKVEMKSAGKQGLEQEVNFFRKLKPSLLFPEFVYFNSNSEFRFLVMELLGPSISIRGKVWKGLCQSKKMNIVKQMLKCIEELYQMNILHCDIKPSNFLFRNVDDDPRICLVDFGLAKKITDPQNMNNISHRANEYKKVISNKIRNIFSRKKRVHNVNANSNTTTPKSFCGTLRYASINVMDGYEPTLKDDLISWFYSITELLTGGLPWDGSHGREETRRIKAESTSQELCAHLPKEFLDIYQYLISLNEQPNFKWINDKLSQASFNYCNVKNTDNNMCMKVEYDMIGDCKSR